MDSQVLIRAIQAFETIFGRVNSKRLLVFFAYLLFLIYCDTNPLRMYLSAVAFLLTMLLVWKQPKNNDSLDGK